MHTSNEKISGQPDLRLGIDLGGSKTEVVVLDGNFEVVFQKRVTTPAHEYEAILTMIVDLVREASAGLGSRPSVGIGTPGAISPSTGRLRNSNTRCLNGKPFQTDIERRLDCAVKLQNDANCFTLSEAWNGAGKDYLTVFGVILGTGTGGGLVVNRQLLTGPNAITGEWGHNPLPWVRESDQSLLCYCGKHGCIETYISGSGLANNFQQRTGVGLSSEQIVQAAGGGDRDCIAAMEIYFDQLARALAHVINIIDPDVVVLGGGMSNIGEIYRQLPERLLSYVFSESVMTPILPALHGDASGVFGAAML
jgi:fructokinase